MPWQRKAEAPPLEEGGASFLPGVQGYTKNRKVSSRNTGQRMPTDQAM